jgi:hypothetical protein
MFDVLHGHPCELDADVRDALECARSAPTWCRRAETKSVDVQSARDNGAFCIAVATGGGTRDELSAAGADVVLDSLADTAAVLALLDQ